MLAIGASPSSAATCAWRAGEILKVSGEVESGGLKGRFTRAIESGSGRSTERSDLGIIATARGYDGRFAWVQDMSGGVHDLDSGFARRLAVSMAWLDARQGCAAASIAGLTPLGVREDDGRRFAAWRAAPAGGVAFELWSDAATGRVDRAFFQTAETRVVRHFADWRDIGGGRFAAFELRDQALEDEDATVFHVRQAGRVAGADFARPVPPRDATILAGKAATVVRYEDDRRSRIYVPVLLNGKGPFTFELDNGGHFILSVETAQALGLDAAGSFNSTGAGNAVSKSGIARLAEVRIGDARLTDQPVRVRSFSAAANDRSPRPARAGLLGLELFERFIVLIDRQKKTVELRRFGTLPKPEGTAVPLVFAEDAPLVAGSFAGHAGDFMLDTGNAGATIIEDYWVHPLGLVGMLGKGVARGETRVSKGDVGLGPFMLGGEQISYYGPAIRGSEYTRAVAGIYGEPLLSRLNATYDYSRKTVWLSLLPDIEAVAFDPSGLSLAKAGADAFAVSAVLPGSPAAEAGFRQGDVIHAIDGTSASRLSRADAVALLRRDAGTAVHLEGPFGVRTLTLRQLL